MFAEFNELGLVVRNAIEAGDLVLFLGAGDITKVAHELAAKLRAEIGARTSCPPVQEACMDAASENRFTAENSRTGCPRSDVFAKLRAGLSAQSLVRQDEPLAKRTTLRVGGNADFYAEPANEADLARLLQLCAELELPFTIIGRGSNLLIRDGGIRGVVIGLTNEAFSKLQIIGEHMHCGAGVKLKTVSVEARRAGLAGLEFLEGIPGSVRRRAANERRARWGRGCSKSSSRFGSWISPGNTHERKASEVNVEYRGCPLFKRTFALGAILRGTPAPKEVIAERANTFNAKRWETQPAQPSAGCIFKNPKTVPAGKLIEELGLKGTRRGRRDGLDRPWQFHRQ
jgi:UDP-N-acetylenolpyruvoylglucosamine reductase